MNEIELYILEKIKKDWVIRTIKENLLEKKEQSKIMLDLIRCLKLQNDDIRNLDHYNERERIRPQ